MSESILADKSVDFAVRIVKFYKFLVDEKKEFVMSKQILRSGTSIGANIAEAQNAQSAADFISKLYISLKEAGETKYWFKILEKSDTVSAANISELKKTLDELIAMLVSSIKTKKTHKWQKK